VTTRRRFLLALGGALAAAPNVRAWAQPKVARVGFLYFASRQSALEAGRYQAFVQGMRELGYVEGTNLVIEARFADGSAARIPALAAELVRSNVALIVASGTVVTRVLQYATPDIPVLTTVTNDPIGDGFAASMAHPGGHITGLTFSAADLGPKMLELLKATVPKATRIAVLVTPENQSQPPQLKRIMLAAQRVAPLRILSTYVAARRKLSTRSAPYRMRPPASANPWLLLTAGSRCLSAWSAMARPSCTKNPSARTMVAWTCSLAIMVNSCSISGAVPASASTT